MFIRNILMLDVIMNLKHSEVCLKIYYFKYLIFINIILRIFDSTYGTIYAAIDFSIFLLHYCNIVF